MRDQRLPALLSLLAGLSLAGCATTSSEGGSETAAETKSTVAAESDKKAETARTEKVAEKTSQSSTRESGRASTRESARESSREPDRPSASTATAKSEARDDGANSPTRLIAQLNDATKEIAALRAANAKLKAGLPASASSSSSATRETDPLDEKLSGKVKSYASFKQELAGVFAENDKLRSDNAALTAQLKESSSGSKEVKATIAKLESDLKAEKVARVQAEQATAKLREQLRVVASAISGVEPSTTSDSRSRSSSTSVRRHVLKDGETLERLADRYYGDATKWRTILEANRGRLPLDGTLPSGLELEIPAK